MVVVLVVVVIVVVVAVGGVGIDGFFVWLTLDFARVKETATWIGLSRAMPKVDTKHCKVPFFYSRFGCKQNY